MDILDKMKQKQPEDLTLPEEVDSSLECFDTQRHVDPSLAYFDAHRRAELLSKF